ncbi:hypothetical protein AN958_07388 [Leucoagaricus sp. SymC.cos]|nr:hypothetical protein AN958_07388 [Leucoagaricus sp. SymC.cos]
MNLKKVFRVDFWKRVRFSKSDKVPRPSPAIPTARSRAADDDVSLVTTADQNEPPTVTVINTVQPNNEGANPSSAAATLGRTRLATSAQASTTSLNIPPGRSGTPAVLEPASASTPNLVVPSNVSQHVLPPITPNTANSNQAPDENTVYLNSPAIVAQESTQPVVPKPLSTSSPYDPSSQWPTCTTAQAPAASNDKSWVQIVAPHGSSVGGGSFNQAQNFTINNPIFNDYSSNGLDTLMRDFAKHTIRGAAVDSSARDPPPRCHPGTRLSTIEETHSLCSACLPPQRLAWIVGPAGVGKSAIMQTVAETLPNMGAALFLSVNGRDDSTKVIATLAYQLAAKFPCYCDYVRAHASQDPTVFEKSMSVQFNDFIAVPFGKRHIYRGQKSLVMFIDGVDEYVEKYLRDSFSKIQTKYPALRFRPQWPTEHQVIQIVAAARGLFAYGNTAIRFVEDPEFGDPQSQLELLLDAINDSLTRSDDGLNEDPLTPLHALYDRIISRIPKRTFPKTVRLLYFTGILPGHNNHGYTLAWAAEWLRMTPDMAYGCLHHLHSVLRIPPTLGAAVKGKVEAHHKSFKDYLLKKFPEAKEESQKIFLDSAVSILKEVWQGMY